MRKDIVMNRLSFALFGVVCAVLPAMAECTVEVRSDGTAATAAEYADALMALL